ncbi:uncharacterized protein LOC62_03G003851 [Vanrija pseudolonga]|uniref:Uncharacterized protein n=1 Tax=Vanrija pseudolonga TaxID=143232 RepID=A0AAF0Y596_9TREE|nr:hypothetical protein LOC62_03G003851 [Vanrija pseudolonga]
MAYAFSKLVGDWERVLLALHDVQTITAANKRAGRQASPDTQARHLAIVAWVSGVAEQAFWSIEHLAQHLDALSRAELTGAIPLSFAPSPEIGDYVLRCSHREPAPPVMNSYAFAVCADVVRRARSRRPDAASDAGLGLLDEEILHPSLARAAAAAFGVLKEMVDERQLGELRRAREAVPKVRRTNFAKRWSEKRPPPTPPALPAHEHALLMALREDAALVALGASPPMVERTAEHAPIYGALMRKAEERDDAPPAPPLKSPSFAFGRY